MIRFQNIAIVGSGNVAHHFAKHLSSLGPVLKTIYSRDPAKAQKLAERSGAAAISDLTLLPADTDLVIISVTDSAMSEVLSAMPSLKAVVVHTAGSVSIDTLNRFEKRGILYPLQSLSAARDIDFKEVPLLVEGSTDEVSEMLMDLGSQLSASVSVVNSEQRRFVHLSAVFAANFTNAMYAAAAEVLKTNTFLPFDILMPLMIETARKAGDIGPLAAQTGPAKRFDRNIIEKHLNLLPPELRGIYAAMTELIQNQQNEKL